MPRPLSPGRWLLRVLEQSPAPLYALDGQRRIVFVSQSLAEWVGIEAEKLIGLRCDYHTGGDGPLTSAAAALCPPPEALAGAQQTGEVGRPSLGERPAERRSARFLRLAGPAGGEDALLLVAILPESPPASAAEPADAPRLHALLANLRGQMGKRYAIGQLIGTSEPMARVREQVRIAAAASLAAKVPARVLVIGPRGSGREHVARTIHYSQPAAAIGPLVPIACPLVDAEQMQQALTALLRKQADSPADTRPAALLIDVDRLPPTAQQELAGFLQLPSVELHALATARTSLTRLSAKGRFRLDLAHALSTLSIGLPPLAARPGDIPLLAQHFVEKHNAEGSRQLSGLTPAAAELLLALPWKGNLDELASAVREACQRSPGPLVSPADFPDWVHLADSAAQRPQREEDSIHLDQFLENIEREILVRALRKARGNKTRAAELLGVIRNRLLRRLAQFGLIEPAPAEEPVVFEPLPDDAQSD